MGTTPYYRNRGSAIVRVVIKVDKRFAMNAEFEQYMSQYIQARDEILSRHHNKELKRKGKSVSCKKLPIPVKDALFISRDFSGTIKDLILNRSVKPDEQSMHLSDLFWPNFYLAIYPDLPRTAFDAWIHYLEFGTHEGRSPHPLLDVTVIDSQIKEFTEHPTLLAYFLNPENWTLSANRWTDVGRFIDGHTDELQTNVTTTIYLSPNRANFIDNSMLTIDATGSENHLILGPAMLYFAAKFNFDLMGIDVKISKITEDPSFIEVNQRDVLFFPSFGFVSGEDSWCQQMLAIDKTGLAIRIGDVLATPDTKIFDRVQVDFCAYFPEALYRNEILNFLRFLPHQKVALIPNSMYQCEAFRQLITEKRLDSVTLIDKPTLVNAKDFTVYRKSDKFSVDVTNPEIRKIPVCLLVESTELNDLLIDKFANFDENISIIQYLEFQISIGLLISAQNRYVVASQRAIELFGGFLMEEKVIDLESWHQT